VSKALNGRVELRAEQIEVVDDAMAEVLRAKTPAERLEMVGELWCSAREWIDSAVRWQHPEWDEAQVLAEVRRRMSGGAT